MIVVMSAAVGVVALVLSAWVPNDRGGQLEDDDEEGRFREAVAIFTDARLMPLYSVIVINMFLVGILFGFLPVSLHGLGYTAGQSGAILTIATAKYLLIQPAAGIIGDRYGMRTTVLLGSCVAAFSIIAMTWITGWTLIATVVAAGLGIGTVWTNSDALVRASAASGRLGASIGAVQSFKEFGDMVGPLLVGALTQLFGIRVGFVTCGSVAMILLVMLARTGGLRAGQSPVGIS